MTVKALNLSGGTTKISGTLTFDGSSLTADSGASIAFEGGSIVLKQSGSFDIKSNVSVSSKGGMIDFGQSNAELDFSNGMSVKGVLNLKGDGVVKLSGTVTGGLASDVINVGASGIVKFENGSLCTATVEISEEAAKLGCTVGFEEAFEPTEMETHIKVGIKNFGDGVKLDLKGLSLKGVSIKEAYYEAGKIHIIYDYVASPENRGVPRHHELIFDNVSGKTSRMGRISR
ncbi:MAG: hypothetical protein AAYR33_05915 [Acetobacteraceae bacterium]